MSVWLQVDSSARKDAYILNGNCWFPNDFRYNQGQNQQIASEYRIFYGDLNSPNNRATIGFPAHCRERRENLTYDAEICLVNLPACTRVRRPADPVKGIPESVVSIMDEPYVYVTISDIEHSEGNEIYTNNDGGEKATFVAYFDRFQIGTNQDNAAAEPPGIPTQQPPVDGNTWDCPAPCIVANTEIEGSFNFPKYRWVVYKSCMDVPIRIDLQASEIKVRVKDRFGNPLILLEDDNMGAGYPALLIDGEIDPCTPPLPDPNLQTMIVMGLKPNYPYEGGVYNPGSSRF
jgi:hypothetical protein